MPPGKKLGSLLFMFAVTLPLAGGARAQDTTAPAAVTDLAATAGTESATLTFTAPKDTGTGSSGNATAYDIRFSGVPITAANWATAIPVSSDATPQAAGSKETVTVKGLVPLQHYYFAMTSADEATNASALSNVVDATTPATTSAYPTAQTGQPGLTGYYYQFPANLASVSAVPPPGLGFNGVITPDRSVAFTPAYLDHVKIDDQIAFDDPSFADPVTITHFGVRWVGQLTVPKDGSWVLSIRPDDGMRVWLSEKPIDSVNPDPSELIAAGWGGGATVVDSQPLTLSASKSYNLMVDYFQADGGAKAHLQWTGPGTGDHDDIPTTAFKTGAQSLDTSSYGRLNGTVVDSSGQPVFENDITLTNGGSTYSATTDGNGFFTFYLPPGNYTVAGGSPVATVYSHLPTAPVAVASGKITALSPINGDIPPFYESATASPYDDDFSGTTLNSKWKGTDIFDSANPITDPGSVAVHDGLVEITAGGWDINGTGDGAYLTYQTIPGDFAATLKVLAIPSNQEWEMGGLDLRLSTDAGSAHTFYQTSTIKGMQHKIRATNGSDSAEYDLPSDTMGQNTFPVYIKIRRVGDKVAYYWTEDPVKGPIHPSFVLQVAGFKGAQQLVVGPLGCSHGTVTDPGFQFDDFKVFPLTTSTPPTTKLGDVNGDGNVNIADATMALQFAVGNGTPSAAQIAAGDVAGNDGKITIPDVTKILQAAIGAIQL